VEIDWGGSPARIREMGEGPAILLVHGYPLDGAMWSGVARALSARFRVLKPDLPGRGETPGVSEGAIEGYAGFLGAILERMPDGAGIAGFSMGGYAALSLAGRRPEKLRALALVDTRASPDDETGRAKRDEAIATVRASGVAPIADAMVPKLLSPESQANRDLVERLRRIISRQKPETIEADLAAMRDRPDSRPLLPQIAIPTLVLVGEADTLTPPSDAQAMASAIPGAKLVTVPGAGHLTPMERPGAVAAALGEFFAGALGVSASPSPPSAGRDGEGGL
jgi:pimeloyl-ACP methyl ester carboxylesterase